MHSLSTHLASGQPQPIVIEANINLHASEEKLFRLLLRATKDQGLNTTLRVAGGWVRDKLLEASNHSPAEGLLAGSAPVNASKIDIDIALDNMVGAEFAVKLNNWLREHGRHTMNVGIVSRNPEKSKHLETATMKLGGYSLDFVNLRTECYTDNYSRIPSICIGTPTEDAYRRDLTINALFYNINTEQIEDFTGRGLSDLQRRLVRTPLPSRTTFLEDPLRVLRSIRFASRLGFTMSQSLLEAASSAEVHNALLLKVSRERIGAEIEGMISSKAPLHAFHLIVGLGLGPIVFPLPPNMVVPAPPPMRLFQASLLHLTHMTALLEGGSHRMRPATDDERRLGIYASFLWPLNSLHYKLTKKNNQLKDRLVIDFILGDMLKLPTRIVKGVELVHTHASVFRELVARRESEPICRAELGLCLMEVGELWQLAMLMALAVDLSTARGRGFDDQFDMQYVKLHLAWIRRYEALAREIEEQGLVGCWNMKPFLNGHEIKRWFPHIPKGDAFTMLMNEQVRWMLANRHGTAESCLHHLTAVFPEFKENTQL